jgi:hypothetical protein
MYAASLRQEVPPSPDIIDSDETPFVRVIPDRRDTASREQLLQRVRAEFAELPCLRLTRPQAQRLFGLRSDVCDRIMSALVSEGTILRDVDDRYRMPDDAPLNTPKGRPPE